MSPFLGRLTIDRSRVCQDSVAQGGGGDPITRTGHHAGMLIAIRLSHSPARGVLGLALRLGLGLALTWRRLIAIAIRGVLLW